jgi:hypothetical protein
MGGRNEGRKKTGDPRGSQGQSSVMKPFRGKARAIEVHSGKAIHLGIKKTWTYVRIFPTEIIDRSFLTGVNPDDLAMLNDNVYDRLYSWNFPSNDHAGLLVELYKISACFKIF